MSYIQHLIHEILTNLSHEKKVYMKMLRGSPEGGLVCEKNGEKKRYQQCIPMGKTASGQYRYQRRAITERKDIISALATKEYARVALRVINHNIRVLTEAMNALLPMASEDILAGTRKTYKSLPDSYFEPVRRAKATTRRQHAWAEEPYTQSTYKPEKKTKTTSRGLRVRSRAELLIAEMLYRYDIPFRYEQVVMAGRYELAPDFTFLDHEGNPFYWEHCGMMADPDYVNHYLWKRKTYEGISICEWENMIYTYDPGDNIDMREIEAVIQTKILPRLQAA